MGEVDVRTRGLVIEGDVWLDAPPARVFDALTTPEWLQAWWGDDDAYRSMHWRIEPTEGTRWQCEIVTRHGARHALGGEVLRARPPHALTLSWQASWQPDLVTEVSFELHAHDGGTRLELRHTGFRPDFTGLTTHATGWPWVLRWLAAWLQTHRTSTEAR
jgi:glutathione S-transferase